MVPSIAGMDPRYFMHLMQDFKQGERYSTIMGRIAGGYGLLELREMARFFADREWIPARVAAEADLVATGETIHEEHCAECHEDAGRYQDKEIPRLAGQWPAYLLAQLLDYQTEHVPMPQPDKMRNRLAKLSDAELAAVSAYYGQVDATDAHAQDEPANSNSH
jgi:sulfide dehydrogenase cytochrome subunit